MAAWEHARLLVHGDDADVYVQYFTGDDDEPRHLGRTGSRVARRDDALWGGIADLGAGGWELVAVVATPDEDDRLTYYFKRPGPAAG